MSDDFLSRLERCKTCAASERSRQLTSESKLTQSTLLLYGANRSDEYVTFFYQNFNNTILYYIHIFRASLV